MRIVAIRIRTPLIADEGGELSGVVGRLGCLNRIFPAGFNEFFFVNVPGKVFDTKRLDDLIGKLRVLSILEHLVPASPLRFGNNEVSAIRY